MRYGKLTLKELDDVVKLYVKERHTFSELISVEEYCEKYIRKCENCGKILSVDEPEDNLYVGTNYKGEKVRCCDECYKYSNEYESGLFI